MKRFEIDYIMADGSENVNTAFVQATTENEALDNLSDQITPYFYCLKIEENKDGTLK